MNEQIRLLRAERDSMARRFKKTPTPSLELMEDLRIAKRRVTISVRRASKSYGKDLFLGNDCSGSWRFIKAATFTTRSAEKKTTYLDALNEHFAKVVTNDGDQHTEIPAGCNIDDCFCLGVVDVQEVLKLLVLTKTNTAMGPDDIPAFLIKRLAPGIVKHIQQIFNSSLNQSTFPTQWKLAN